MMSEDNIVTGDTDAGLPPHQDHGGLVVGTALRRVYSFVPLRQCAFQRLKSF